MTLKNQALSIGKWSLVYSVIQLVLMGWQINVIQEKKDMASVVQYWPSGIIADWWSPEKTFYNGLLIIQVISLVTSFLLIIATLSLFYGLRKSSKHFIWPWFLVMTSSILSSLAYCIFWWSGYLRDWFHQSFTDWLHILLPEIMMIVVNSCVIHSMAVNYRYLILDWKPIQNTEQSNTNVQLEIRKHLEIIRCLMDSLDHDACKCQQQII